MRHRKQPNVLLIVCDQLRRQALSIYDDPNIATPHIDPLARRGVRFDHACSTYPNGVPFRYTLMTGENAHGRSVPGIGYRMSPAERTLADEVNEAGYETVYLGEWHLDGGDTCPGADSRSDRTPVARAIQGRWEKWYGFERCNTPFDTGYFKNDDPTPHRLLGYQTDGLFDLAIQHLIDRSASRPFCMVLSAEAPYPSFEAPETFAQRWAAKEIRFPDNFDVKDPVKRAQTVRDWQNYYAVVENLDWNTGRLALFLGASRLMQETVVLFSSDHGELGGSHGLFEEQWPYEESIGIPLIVADPRIAERAGIHLADPISTEDLFPTLLGLAGLPIRSTLMGEDLTSLIHGRINRLERPGVLLEAMEARGPEAPFYGEGWRGFRTARYKYTLRGAAEGVPWHFST